MDTLVPELFDQLFSRLDHLSFRSLGCASTQFHEVMCAFPTKPRKAVSTSNILHYGGISPGHLTALQRDAIYGGHLRLIDRGILDVENASLKTLVTFRLFDVIETRYDNGTLGPVKATAFIFHCIGNSKPSSRFLLWFFSTFPDCAQRFFVMLATGTMNDVLYNKIVRVVFLSPDRDDALVALFRQEVRNILDVLKASQQRKSIGWNLWSQLLIKAIHKGRLDTAKWIHEEMLSAMPSLASMPQSNVWLGAAGNTEVLSFILENSECSFTESDVFLSLLKSKENGRELDVFNAYKERMKPWFGEIPMEHVTKIVSRRVTVASFKMVEEFVTRTSPERSEAALALVARNLITKLIRKCNNFTLFRYLVERKGYVDLKKWPEEFFTKRPRLHEQDLKYFKLLMASAPEEWEKFCANYHITVYKAYSIGRTKTIVQVYHFLVRAGVKDSELYRAYCREMGRPCVCCNGKCILVA